MAPEDWLPPLVRLEDFGGDWRIYVEALYKRFEEDFIRSKPNWPGKRVGVKRFPESLGKSATFWHLISTGDDESARIPDLRRCERIGWPRAMMDSHTAGKPTIASKVIWWMNSRGRSNRYVLATRGFHYVVIVEDRGDFVLPWTAYTVERDHQRTKLQREFDAFWKSQP